MFPYTFTHNGRSFAAKIVDDPDHDAPWDSCDGHGPVRQVPTHYSYSAGRYVALGKRPGERILHVDGRSVWLYDWQAAAQQARRDKWGPTLDEALGAEFARLRGWLEGGWWYVGVIVTADDGESEPESLWGIESDSGDYLEEVAHQLAEQHPAPYVHVLGAA
jgi:hypothetical protein